MTIPIAALHALADSYGVQKSYFDDQGKVISATPDALLAVLGVLGAPLQRPEEAADSLRARRQTIWRRAIEPVHVARDGCAVDVPLRLPATAASAQLTCRLSLDWGETKEWHVSVASLPVIDSAEVENVTYRVHPIKLS